jgi:ATP-binding cassette subfamily B multidrug efflux pump
MNTAIVLPAVLLGRAINSVLAYQRGHASAGSVAVAAAVFVAGTAATELPRIGKRWWLGVARTRFQANVRADALRGVLAWPMSDLAAMSVGGVMARIIGDVDVLGLGVGEVITETWDTLLFSASVVVTMFLYAPGLAAISLAPVPIALALAKVSGRLVAARTTAARQTDADLTTVLHEQLGAFRLLRLAGRTGAATGRVQAMADRQAKAELAAIKLDESLGAIYATLLNLGVIFVIWLGGQRVAAGSMSVGGLVAFLLLFARFVRRAPRIPQMANRVQAAGAAYARLEPMLAAPQPARSEPRWSSFRAAHVSGLETSSAHDSRQRPRAAAGIAFREVSFSYPGSLRPTISDLSLDVPAGMFVAITGPVGCGKSALAKLAAGIHTPQAGLVAVAGKPVAELDGPDRRALVGYVGQESHLFSGSVLSNILLSPDHVPREAASPPVERSVELTALVGDINRMPAGLGTEIGELGVRVSGGQRQRISLARALASDGQVPGLLVLDEPFSAVDLHTEASILAGLRQAFGAAAPPEERATILLFSHRLAAFPLADLVVVIEGGRIAEQGRHEQLLRSGGLYAHIFNAQSRLAVSPPIAHDEPR